MIKFGEVRISEKSREHILECLEKNHVTMGPKTALLEQKWSSLFGYKHTVAVSSGTSACTAANISLYDFGAVPGDEVIVPALSFIATGNSIRAAGFRPVFCDVKNDLLINEDLIEGLVTPRTRAIMPVGLMGKPPKVDKIREIANKYNLKVIKDQCLPAGEQIFTINNFKNIEDVEVGDEVLTHDGSFCKVTSLMKNDFNGKMVTIDAYGYHKDVNCTYNHPVYIVRNNKDPVWMDAEDVKVGDYLVFPRYNQEKDVETFDLSGYDHSSSGHAKKIFEKRRWDKVNVDDDLMTLIGWYLAEGWFFHNHFELILGYDEIYVDEVILLLNRYKFDYSITRDKEGGVTKVSVFHKQMALFLKEHFGNGSKNKTIPEWILKLPCNKLQSLLNAYAKGDGNPVKNRDGNFSCTSISLSLFSKLKLICSKLGYFASISKSAEAGFDYIQGRKVTVQDKYQLRYSTNKNKDLTERVLITDKHFLLKVKKIKSSRKKTKVYNFEVEKNHSYVVGGYIFHNCESHGCQYKGLYIKNWSDIVVYSCYAAHILFSGEMGFACTDDDRIADILRSIRSHGRKPGSLYFDHFRYGLNLKPTDIHASIGLGNVDDFWMVYDKRKSNWVFLRENLKCYENDYFWLSDEDAECDTSPHGFSITVKPNTKLSCSGLKTAFDNAGIEWKRNFGSMPTQHGCFSYLGYKLGDFPVAEYIGDNGIHIGVHYYLTEDDLKKIVDTVKSYVEGTT